MPIGHTYTHFASLLVLGIATGCASGETSEALDDDALSTKATSAAAREVAAAQVEPSTQLGVRVRKYNGYFNRSNASEAQMWDNLEGAVALVNAQSSATHTGASIAVAELATNLLAEGAVLMLEQSAVENLSSFDAFGLDSLVDQLPRYSPLLPAELRTRLQTRDQNCHFSERNELGQKVATYTCLSMRDAVYAAAAMLSVYKGDAASNVPGYGSLGLRQQFYWTTYFFNAGLSTAKRAVQTSGPGLADKPWAGLADTPANVGSNSARPKFNALWRSVAYDYVRAHNMVEPPAAREETMCAWHPGAAVQFMSDVALVLPQEALAGTAVSYKGLVTDALGDALTFDAGALANPSCLVFDLSGPGDGYTVCTRSGACGLHVGIPSGEAVKRVYITATSPTVCVPYTLSVGVQAGACL